MQFTRNTIAAGVLIAVAFGAGYWLHKPTPSEPTGRTRKPLYYHDPMHPAYRSDKPGIAPDCGMALEPVYAEGTVSPAAAPAVPGAVRISYDKQQMIGLATERVVSGAGHHTVRLVGRVTADESRVFKVTALAEGVVRSVAPVGTGSLVKKDDLLATYFVAQRDLYNAFQNFFAANNNLDRGISSQDQSIMDSRNAQIRLTEELLQTYGLTETQMRQMAVSRQVTRDIQFRAPAAGVILSRAVSAGQKLDRGTEIFRIADLSHVWVLADVFERDSALIRDGQTARVRYQGKTYGATMTGARDFDPKSRTLKVRLDLDNPALTLRPDMFVELELDVAQGAGIDVPIDAVLNTGKQAVVFVAQDDGTFEPREVVAGNVTGRRLRIVKGLAEGEKIVVSGLFLLDSESQLQIEAQQQHNVMPVSAATGGAESDPVCGMKLASVSAAVPHSEYHGHNYHFCSPGCQSKFDADPGLYAAKR